MLPMQPPPKNGTLGYAINGRLFEKLPDNKVCLKRKESSPFFYSKKELKTFTERGQRGQRLDVVTAKLRCRECFGDPTDGIFCEHCEMIKPRDDLTQAARNRPARAWCRPCVYWQKSGEPAAKTLPVPPAAAPQEGKRKYAPESAEEKAARLAKAQMKVSSVNSPSLKSSNTLPPNPVASWLHSVNSSQAAKSMINEDEVMSTANYSTEKSALGCHANDDEIVRTPKATGSLFKHMLQCQANTPISLLDMDDEGSLQLSTTTKPLQPKALFSNTILTPISKVASESLHPETNGENWQNVEYKKKTKTSPLKTVSSSDDSGTKRNLVAYGVNPDGTYKWRPKDDFDFEDDAQDILRTHMAAKGKNDERKSVLQRYLDELEPGSFTSDADFEIDLAGKDSDLLDAKTPFHAPSLKSHKLDADIPVISKVDYSKAFCGIDPLLKQKRSNDGSKQKIAEKAITVNQKENQSTTAAADLLDDQLYESAIRRHATTSATKSSAPETSNF